MWGEPPIYTLQPDTWYYKAYIQYKERVYNALIWLMDHNEDYRDVEMDKAEFDSTPLPKELLDELRWEDDIAQRTRSVYNL